MKRSLLACFTLLALWTVWTPLHGQLPFTLSGTVFGGGTGLSGVVVEALQDGTTTVVGSVTTDGAGRYSLALPAATYDLRVTPPPGSGFAQEVIQDIAVDANRQQDIVLVAGASLSGVVRGYGGNPVANARVELYTSSTQFIASVTTSAAGEYAFNVASGTYRLIVNGFALANAPRSFSADHQSVAVSGTTVRDFDLPVVRLEGAVTDAGGAPVSGATVEVRTTVNDFVARKFLNATGLATSDSLGRYVLLAYAGPATITVQKSGVGSTTESATFTGDSPRDFVLGVQRLRGVLRGLGGRPVPNASVQLYNQSFQFLTSVATAADGSFGFGIDDGTYQLRFFGPAVVNTSPSFFWEVRNVAVSGVTTRDVDVPVAQLSGMVTDPVDQPAAGAQVRRNQNWFDSVRNGSASSDALVTTAADGSYSLLTLVGPGAVSVRPPAGSPYGVVVDTTAVAGSEVRNYVLSQDVSISGRVTGYGGLPVPNVVLQLDVASLNIASTTTDADGRYLLRVSPGTYRVRISQSGLANVPSSFFWQRSNVSVAGAEVLDIPLPVARVSGRIVDSNGAPVPGVRVQGSSFGSAPSQSWNSSPGSILSGADGRYAVLLLTGSANLSFAPPTASGFAGSGISNLQLAGDLNQIVVLQRPDTTAPSIVSGPTVIHLSDTSVSIGWTTDEPATSKVEFGIGSLTRTISDNALTTNHSVTLTSLEPVATYTYRVSSIDRSGNGPAVSAQGFFTTHEPPGDITPPVITGGPAVAFVDQTTAIIQWTTDEPSTSDLEYGETPALGTRIQGPFGRFVQSHSVRITGLTAATSYFVQVHSGDPDGNEISSGTFTFTTLTVPDTQAPIITAGPAVSAISDTRLTVTWTTNEPSSSGVSYNDGTVFNVVTDDAFVRQHSVTLTGLKAQTTYRITVSSTDAVGNGPTLGGPIDATTEAAPDRTAPVLSGIVVEDIGRTSAAVVWRTDEPATSAVAYGRVSGAPNDTKADVTLSTDHRLLLTGLQPGTTYYFVVSSADAAGNRAASAESSFATEPEVIDNPPGAPGTPSASPNPSASGSFTLSWNPATDDKGVTGYVVVRGGSAVATVPGTSTMYEESGLGEGSYQYRIKALDAAGQSAESDPVTVIVDQTAPLITAPSAIEKDAPSPTGGAVEFAVTAEDNYDPNPAITCTPASGSEFPIGSTTVGCEAKDAAGNSSSASFRVTLWDVFAPSVTVPAGMNVNATSPAGAVVHFTVTASDNVDPAPAVSCSHQSGATFPIGATIVSCKATDASGNASNPASFTIDVASPTEQMADTKNLIESLNLSEQTEQSLLVKLDQALTAPNVNASCNELGALINSTRAQQRSGRISDADADAIITATQGIMLAQGCR